MTTTITIPRETFDAMQEALESSAVCIQLMSDGPSRASWGDTLDIIDAALDAAKAVTSECSKVTSEYSEQATIAGLEASIGHLSALVNEQLLLLEEVNENLGVDGIGVELEDDQSPTIAKVRAHLAAMAPPVQPQARCQYCDGTGDVHAPTGEWRGSCNCKAIHPQATEPQAQEPKLPVYFAQYEYAPDFSVIVSVYQRRPDAVPLLIHSETLPKQIGDEPQAQKFTENQDSPVGECGVLSKSEPQAQPAAITPEKHKPQRVCNRCKGTGMVHGLHNWVSGGVRSQECWDCSEVEPASNTKSTNSH